MSAPKPRFAKGDIVELDPLGNWIDDDAACQEALHDPFFESVLNNYDWQGKVIDLELIDKSLDFDNLPNAAGWVYLINQTYPEEFFSYWLDEEWLRKVEPGRSLPDPAYRPSDTSSDTSAEWLKTLRSQRNLSIPDRLQPLFDKALMYAHPSRLNIEDLSIDLVEPIPLRLLNEFIPLLTKSLPPHLDDSSAQNDF